ncbi:MAG: gas vesicle protein GvpC, partial [bacterium]
MAALMERIRQENNSIFEEVNLFLSETKSKRFTQAKKQAEELRQFQQQLKQTTDEFLTNAAKER